MDDKEIVRLLLAGKAPANITGGVLNFKADSGLANLPETLRCHTLRAPGSALRTVPPGLEVTHKLDLSGSKALESLPRGLKTSVLVLRDCTALKALPEDLQVDYLDISNCTQLAEWPESAQVSIGNINARNCPSLKKLPERLGPVTSLNLRDCALIDHIPDGVEVHSWIDFSGTKVTALPPQLRNVGLRWRGVAATPRIVFEPETLTSAEILQQRNAEVRRIMIERAGMERFLSEANAEVMDEDQDPGGQRRLLRLKLQGDEDLVCVSVNCPSTARHYLIRVPPTMKTCRQAVAWTAGFDDENDYAPLVET